MSKYLLSAAAVAAVMLGASSGANADIFLPNDNWSTVAIGSEPQTDSGKLYIWNGQHCKVVLADQTVTVTTFAAENPGGNIVLAMGTDTQETNPQVSITDNANLGNVADGEEGCVKDQDSFVANP